MPTQPKITKDELAKALAIWEREAREEKWQPREDEDRHADNASYLFGLVGK